MAFAQVSDATLLPALALPHLDFDLLRNFALRCSSLDRAGLAAFYAIRCLDTQDAGSLPLDGRRGLAGDIVNHAVDAAYFVYDAV